MKLLTDEEIDAHWYATAGGALKGLCAGLIVTGAIFKLGARKYPGFPKNLPWSIRTAIFISPPTVGVTIGAEEASNAFDREMYSGDYDSKRRLEEYNQWSKLPLNQKLLQGAINHKYKIIVGAWAASMYGSWVYVDRDPIMTKTQKIVQARMYAQFLTVGLLLGSIGLSMYDEKNHPEHYKKDELSDWEKILIEEEERKKQEQSAASYKRARIYKD
jgi:hypothetical protein